jgi:hypothetical protein
MFVSSAVLVLNTLISANVDGHFELFLQSKEEITLVGGLVARTIDRVESFDSDRHSA